MEPLANSEVPVNSTLKVKVTGTGSASQQFFVAHGTFERPDRSREEWMDTELRAGLSRPLPAAGGYLGRLDLHFFKQSTARLQMEIVDASNNVLESYDESVSQSSDFDRTFILLVVRPPAAPAPAAKKMAKKAAKKAAKKGSGK